MRVLLQRIKYAECRVEGKEIGRSGRGFLLLAGFTAGDNEAVIGKMAKKIANLRVFPDADGKMNLSILNIKGSVLSIPQFTLYANTGAGNRPSFTDSLDPALAKPLYVNFNAALEDYGLLVAVGVFGAHMEIELINEGPVTMMLEFKG